MNKGIKVLGLQQGTDEWRRWRDTGIGGSDVAVLMMNGGLFGKDAYTLWRQKTGGVEAKFTQPQQEHMERGNRLEPEARQKFIERTGIYISPVCMQSAAVSYMLASLDGLDETGEVGVEIKAPAEKMFRSILETNTTPEYYAWQIQHQLYVSGASLFYFWAYNKDIPPHIFIEEHTPNDWMIEKLLREEYLFQKHVEYRVAPANDGLGIDNKSLGAAGLIMLAGYAKAGKDTVNTVLSDMLESTRFGFADKLKVAYCQLQSERSHLSLKQLEKTKDKHRTGLINLGHGMRQVYGNVWVDSLFKGAEGENLALHASGSGAVITDCRYLNEAVTGRLFAKRIGVPFRLFWIERPGIEPVAPSEAECTSILRKLADVIVVNDSDISTAEGKQGLELALIEAMNNRHKIVIASEFVKQIPLKKKRVKK